MKHSELCLDCSKKSTFFSWPHVSSCDVCWVVFVKNHANSNLTFWFWVTCSLQLDIICLYLEWRLFHASTVCHFNQYHTLGNSNKGFLSFLSILSFLALHFCVSVVCQCVWAVCPYFLWFVNWENKLWCSLLLEFLANPWIFEIFFQGPGKTDNLPVLLENSWDSSVLKTNWVCRSIWLMIVLFVFFVNSILFCFCRERGWFLVLEKRILYPGELLECCHY